MSERLSALIDNELDDLERERALKALGRDPQLSAAWSRYHLIRFTMRGDRIAPRADLAERVTERIRDEAPPAPAPAAAAGADRAPTQRAPEAAGAGARLGLPRNLALAASVAAVLLVGGVVLSLQDGASVDPVAAQGDARIVAAEQGMRWEGVDPQTEDALNALLVEHGEFTGASGMNGLSAYTKFVAYDSQ